MDITIIVLFLYKTQYQNGVSEESWMDFFFKALVLDGLKTA